MLNFSPISLTDKPWIDRIIRLEDSRSCDWCFTSIFVWDAVFCQHVAAAGERLVVKIFYQGGVPFYAFPIGEGALVPVVEAMRQDIVQYDTSFRIRGITVKNLQELEAAFPGQFIVTPDCFAFDYVYEAEKLATLAGKKLSAKRNHINRFLEQNPDWLFEPITAENLPLCIAMAERWAATHEKTVNFASELDALALAFAHFDALGLEGGLLRSDGEVIAFTMGEPLNSDTYIIHFEKAFSTIQGAYPMINREFARYIRERHPHIQYINREDDLGIESLKKAKRSYYPAFMVEKYTAHWKEN
ncbi:MAG: phosphatidylglycerol lysyltransferase domain-containing protein [Oscillospiraceae bacterium]|nr:phosphatidylglycerol lysyltransferase domain-containing protein [Oscillospiraceae bacterium]